MFDLVEGGEVVQSDNLLPVFWSGKRLRYLHNQGQSIAPWCLRKENIKPSYHEVVQTLITEPRVLSTGKTSEKHTVIDMPLDEAKQRAHIYITSQHNALVKVFTGGASDAVEKGWAQQSTELRAYDAYIGEPESIGDVVPFIASKAAIKGRTIQEQIEKLRVKAGLFAVVCGKADALRENYEDAIDASSSVQEIVAVFDMAKKHTDAFLAELANA